ncbi:MAG: CHAT domain-containing protein [Chloroflexi bacterium]|nr:CHAT domain-containing protein [Chloroflexota bacterium]
MSEDHYTLRIYLTDYDDLVRVQLFDPAYQLLKEPGGKFRYAQLRAEIEALNQVARDLQLTAVQVKSLGETLFNALFDDVLRVALVDYCNQFIHAEKKRLRLELDINEEKMPDVAALPWEFMRLPTEANLGTLWLATAPDLVFSRYRWLTHVPSPINLRQDEKLRLALVVANPSDNLPGPVAYEEVADNLAKLVASQPAQFELLPIVLNANALAIDDLLSQSPHILHFIGHGRMQTIHGRLTGQVGLIDDLGGIDWVDEDVFSDLLNTHRPGVVFLQACESSAFDGVQAYTGVAARVVGQNIPVVVAMQYKVTNSAATRFALRFYQQLAAGDPVDRAAQYGRRVLGLQKAYATHDFATPVLYMRVRDGRLFQRRLTNTTPPLAIQNEQKLRDALWQLNFSQQRNKFLDLLDKPRIGAFLISGPGDECGQRWLLNRLVQNELEDAYEANITDRCQTLRASFSGVLSPTLDRLWRQLRKQLPDVDGYAATPDDILTSLAATWQERDVVIILEEVGNPGPDFPEKLLQEFWQPLVQKLAPSGSAQNWFLLVLVDNKGVMPAPVAEQPGDASNPLKLIWLPSLSPQMPRQELLDWLRDGRTRRVVLQPAQTKLHVATVNDVLDALLDETDNGVTDYVIEELCRLCDYEWSALQKKWLKL